MSKRWAPRRAVLAVALGLLPGQICAGVFDVKTFGAKGDGKTPDRDCHQQGDRGRGGGRRRTVYFPAGTYVTGSIRLRSNLTLQFEPGASARSVRAIRPPTMRRSPTSGTSFRTSATAISTTA